VCNIWQKIEEADMVLIGLGEEFDDRRTLNNIDGYEKRKGEVVESSSPWLLPAYQKICREEGKSLVGDALSKLAKCLESKNYFVLSVSMNDSIRQVAWKEGRLVMPCGGSAFKQCEKGCESVLEPLTQEDYEKISARLKVKDDTFDVNISLGQCPECGAPLILNNVYTENYNENGYLHDWEIYTKWLQGTLNKKLLILELGVGMQFPSVIRFPFEKIAFYNNKAEFYRVNEKLYHLTEELKEKGKSISENAIDWLLSL